MSWRAAQAAKQSPIYQAKVTCLEIASSPRTLLAMTYTTALMQMRVLATEQHSYYNFYVDTLERGQVDRFSQS